MWYPLNRSIVSLWLASAALFTLLLVGSPVEAEREATPAQEPTPLTQAMTLLAERLPIDDPEEKARVALALQLAAMVVEHRMQAAQGAEQPRPERAAERVRARMPQSAMPFFSFASIIHRPRESGT